VTNKMENKKYHTVETVPKLNHQNVCLFVCLFNGV